jgi:hypothetical protein
LIAKNGGRWSTWAFFPNMTLLFELIKKHCNKKKLNNVKSTFFQNLKRNESLLFLVLIIAGMSLPGWIFG